MDLESKVKKMGLGHEQGFGAPCLKCKDKCEGFELHFWRTPDSMEDTIFEEQNGILHAT